ncbi:hypothetical protein HMPREF9120_02708 [Neisseria sp. oral taxon 020 str. F0370]|nr:hypothetical protein HMPREF9120_02708 [Neisseria sp. oral taxon 020 str. F0370]
MLLFVCVKLKYVKAGNIKGKRGALSKPLPRAAGSGCGKAV